MYRLSLARIFRFEAEGPGLPSILMIKGEFAPPTRETEEMPMSRSLGFISLTFWVTPPKVVKRVSKYTESVEENSGVIPFRSDCFWHETRRVMEKIRKSRALSIEAKIQDDR
jgi:hypothetical protein